MIQTSQGPMEPEALVDYLTYANYRHNRNIAPHLTPAQFAKCGFPNVEAMEARYQAEKAIQNARSA